MASLEEFTRLYHTGQAAQRIAKTVKFRIQVAVITVATLAFIVAPLCLGDKITMSGIAWWIYMVYFPPIHHDNTFSQLEKLAIRCTQEGLNGMKAHSCLSCEPNRAAPLLMQYETRKRDFWVAFPFPFIPVDTRILDEGGNVVK